MDIKALYLQITPQKIKDIVTWKDPKLSAPIFLAGLTLLASLSKVSPITLLSYVGLALVTLTTGIKITVSTFRAVSGRELATPIDALMAMEPRLTADHAQKIATSLRTSINSILQGMHGVLLTEDFVKPVLTCIGLGFLNKLTSRFTVFGLLGIVWTGLFTLAWPYFRFENQVRPWVAWSMHQVDILKRELEFMLHGI